MEQFIIFYSKVILFNILTEEGDFVEVDEEIASIDTDKVGLFFFSDLKE